MTDSLSVAAMLGAATATLQKVQLLYTTIDNFKDAPDSLHNVKVDIQAITHVLHNIVTACPCDSSQIVASAEVKTAIENCCKICTDFQDLLTRWKWHAAEKENFWVDKWRVSLSGQERIRAFKGQLNLCKDILAVALSTASIITKFRHQEEIMSEVKEMMLKQNETVLQKELVRADGERAETETSLPQISVNDSNWLSDESKQSRWELLQDIRRQQAFNDAFRRVCEQALAITVSERTGHKAEGVHKTDSTHFLNGFINTSAEGSLMDYDSSDVTTDSGSFDMSGFIQDAQHNHSSGHVCCLTLGILDLASPNNQQTHGPPSLDLSSQSDNFLLEPTEYSSMIGMEDSQSEIAQISQDLVTPTTYSTRSSEPQARGKEKPVCWEHGCQGRVFSSWSNLRRHQREKARQEPACYCPRCGAYFSRTSGRDQHLANMSCTRIRRYSNGRIRPNILKIQETLGTPL